MRVLSTPELRSMLYVLGIICFVPFDWCARRRVESHMNFFILNPQPMPRPPRDSRIRTDIARTAGRLACIDDRFAEVTEALRVPCGPSDPEEKADLIAQLDALAAFAYGLTEDEFRLMFEDFPETEAGVSPARRAATLDHFRRLAAMPARAPRASACSSWTTARGTRWRRPSAPVRSCRERSRRSDRPAGGGGAALPPAGGGCGYGAGRPAGPMAEIGVFRVPDPADPIAGGRIGGICGGAHR